MTRKLDIFVLLGAIDQKDQDFYGKLDADARKEFAPPVALRWASAVNDGEISDFVLLNINERANIGFWDISDHPELQYKLLASCGIGKKLRHHWIANKQKNKSNKVRSFVAQFYPTANDSEIDTLMQQFTSESFREFVDISGLEPKDAKEIIKQYDQEYGKTSEETDKKGKGKRKVG